MTNMSRARVARRIAAGAAYGGGGVGLVGAAAVTRRGAQDSYPTAAEVEAL